MLRDAIALFLTSEQLVTISIRRAMTSSDRVLYWASGSPPCMRVQIALEEKGLKYESKLISLSESGTPLGSVLPDSAHTLWYSPIAEP